MTDSSVARPRSPRARSHTSPRRLARQFALQGVYAWLLGGEEGLDELGAIDAHVRAADDFDQADLSWYHTLLQGAVTQATALRAQFGPHVDRPLAELSPIEHAILLIASFELVHRPEVPYRVAINEAVELAKSFGGTDGYRFVNGVLDRLAAEVREPEVRAAAARR